MSRYYRAPELILASEKYDFSIDIWAVGCILFELLVKTPMFPGESEGLQILEMQQILGPPSDQELKNLENYFLESSVHEFFERICKLEKNQKLDIQKMLMSSSAFYKHHIYSEQDLKDATDMITKCLKWVPTDRITALEAINHPFCQE